MKYGILIVLGLAIIVAIMVGTKEASAPVATEVPEATTTDTGTVPVPAVPADVQAAIDAKHDLIVVTNPAPGSSVSSPITVTGQARGSWFFEASFPLVVVDWDGKIIGEGHATADGEWMTSEFVPFTGTIEYGKEAGSYSDAGAIIFQKDNPSGLPEHDDALEIPVILN